MTSDQKTTGRRVLTGRVVSDKMDKTVTVEVKKTRAIHGESGQAAGGLHVGHNRLGVGQSRAPVEVDPEDVIAGSRERAAARRAEARRAAEHQDPF